MFQNARVDSNRDSRNVAVQEFIINVENVADTPPIFISAPPVTRLPETSKIGDFVCNIVAVDGDKGLRRPIRYILDTRFIMKSSNFLNFFFLFQIQYICCLFQAWLHHWSSYCEKKFTRTGSRFGSRSSLAFENNSSGSSRQLLSSWSENEHFLGSWSSQFSSIKAKSFGWSNIFCWNCYHYRWCNQ